jgi:hypothetical protein
MAGSGSVPSRSAPPSTAPASSESSTRAARFSAGSSATSLGTTATPAFASMGSSGSTTSYCGLRSVLARHVQHALSRACLERGAYKVTARVATRHPRARQRKRSLSPRGRVRARGSCKCSSALSRSAYPRAGQAPPPFRVQAEAARGREPRRRVARGVRRRGRDARVLPGVLGAGGWARARRRPPQRTSSSPNADAAPPASTRRTPSRISYGA